MGICAIETLKKKKQQQHANYVESQRPVILYSLSIYWPKK